MLGEASIDYDAMVFKNPNLPEDSITLIIQDISDKAKERHWLSNDKFEQLNAWLGIQKEKR